VLREAEALVLRVGVVRDPAAARDPLGALEVEPRERRAERRREDELAEARPEGERSGAADLRVGLEAAEGLEDERRALVGRDVLAVLDLLEAAQALHGRDGEVELVLLEAVPEEDGQERVLGDVLVEARVEGVARGEPLARHLPDVGPEDVEHVARAAELAHLLRDRLREAVDAREVRPPEEDAVDGGREAVPLPGLELVADVRAEARLREDRERELARARHAGAHAAAEEVAHLDVGAVLLGLGELEAPEREELLPRVVSRREVEVRAPRRVDEDPALRAL